MTPEPIPDAFAEQHRMMPTRLDGSQLLGEPAESGAAAFNRAVEEGRCPICATGQTHTASTCPDKPRQKITTVGYQETAAEVAKLVGATGAHRFALIWTHPEYPTDRPEEPPAGVPVTWTAVACFYGGIRRVTRELQIDRDQLQVIDGRVVVAASCYGEDHGKSIATACTELMRRLGANVTFGGGTPAPVVDNPPDALLEALSG